MAIPITPSPALAASRSATWRVHGVPAPLVATLVVLTATLLAVLDPAGTRPAWERFHQLVVAFTGLVLTWRATVAADGHVRRVRAWIMVAFVTWSAAELLRAIELGFELLVAPVPRPAPSDLMLPAILLTAVGAYSTDLRGRVSRREELAVYLDGAIAAAAATAILLAIFGWAAARDPDMLSLLAHGLLLLAILAGTVLLELAVLPPFKLRGAWLLVMGLAIGAVGFVGAMPAGGTSAGPVLAAAVSAGVLLVALGGATFEVADSPSPRYRRHATRLRDIIPVVAVAPMPVLLLGDAGRAPVDVALVRDGLAAFALVAAVGRQSLMLAERSGVLAELRAAATAAERRACQIAGVEAVGRMLSLEGPSRNGLQAVTAYLRERFGYRHVLLFIADPGGALHLGPLQALEVPPAAADPGRGIVARVARTRALAYVPDVTADPDHVVADPAVRSAASAPLIDGEKLLGVLHVESTTPMDTSDMTAVAAVADQLARALALGGERRELVDEKNFISAVLDTLGALVIVVDRDGRVVRFNRACSEISGYSMAELAARPSFDFLVPVDQRPQVRAAVENSRDGLRPHPHENDWICKDGARRRISWSNTAVVDGAGTVEYTIATGVDVTERRELEAQLAHRALHDPLTGLANRTLLADRIDHALARPNSTVALLFLDLDDFKRINDTLGHITGDVVLRELSRRLGDVLRPTDTAARIGGDEFAVLLEDIAVEGEALDVAERLMDNLSRPLPLEGGETVVHVSTGIALSGESGADGETLLRNADLAMYWAKSRGRARVEVYDASMYAAMRDRRDLETLLRRGIERDEFVVHLQPVVELAGGRTVGMEALVRWSQPERGLVPPGEFLPLADETGAIVAIGRVVLADACRHAADADDSADGPWVSVNLSARQFQDPDLLADVADALESSGLPPQRLMVEITETILMDDLGGTIAKLHQLKDLGVRLAVDDFGTGYSSLSYLRRFPVDLLKIDRSFVADIATDSRQRAFVGAIVALGHSLSIATLAEGIENEAQREVVIALGCELGQGFLFGAPAPASPAHGPTAEPTAAPAAAGIG